MGGQYEMYLEEIGISTRNWVGWAQDRDYWRSLVNVTGTTKIPHDVWLAKIT